MEIALAIGAVVLIVGVAAIVWGTKAAVRRLAAGSAATIEAEFAGREIVRQDRMANYFGLESKGGKQWRGNGALVVTADELWFKRIGADAPLRIPRGAISGTSIVKSHAGKTVGRSLVRVDFEGAGGADAAAWYVADASAWADLLHPS